MNVNIESVQDPLEEQVRKGRTPVEAAGEVRWLAEGQRRSELHFDQTHQDMIQVIDEWLADKMGVPEDEVGPFVMVADAYAQFLGERVSFEASANPIGMVEVAWHEWRATTGGL
jgi:hypothetical protein